MTDRDIIVADRDTVADGLDALAATYTTAADALRGAADALRGVDPPDPGPGPPPPTEHSTTRNGRIYDPTGKVLKGGAINIASTIDRFGPYVGEGLPGGAHPPAGSYDAPGTDHPFAGGGDIATVVAWSPERNAWVTVPDRYREVIDNWRQAAVRVWAVPRGDNDKPAPAQSVPHYVERLASHADAGLTAMASVFNQTGMNLADLGDQRHRDALALQDAVVRDLADYPNVWLDLPNEPWSRLHDADYERVVLHYTERARSQGWEKIIVVPLPAWSQALSQLADGTLDRMAARLGPNTVWGHHAYGADWSGGTASAYDYAALDLHYTACRERGHAVAVTEYGQATPASASNDNHNGAWNRAAVQALTRGEHGRPPLAVEHGLLLYAWHFNGEETWSKGGYKLTEGPDWHGPPAWRVNADRLNVLTEFGRAHWDISHRLAELGAA